MLKNLKKVAAIVLSFAMAVQFGLADSYYVNAVEEPVEPQQEETTTTAPQEQEQEEVPTTEEETPQQQKEGQQQPAVEEEQPAPETKSVELSYVAEDGTVLHETASRDFNVDYSLKTDSSVMLNFDGYTLKDVIINNSQTVPADQANLSVTSDLVSVKFVYVSVNTKEDKQTSENNEQTKTEEASEDDAEADPETKEELPEYPAFDQSETAGNVVVHATAAEGVLPRDSKLVVKRITRKAILNAVEDTVSEKNKEMDSAVALDITIQNKDGVEIQPNGSVNISFENAAVSGDEINVYHVTDDASTVTEVATNTQSFDANHFSIYVITGEKEKPLTTFNFFDANGNIVSTQIVKTGDTLITPTAPDVAGKAFVGWYDGETKFEDFNTALTITETTTRKITAKYENALYVYFYNPAGTQIMRTEKVGDHYPHGYTDVSYDVDSTHKLVGWAAERNGTENIADKITVPEGSTSVNVYAIIKEGYWISFDSDGGSIVDSQFVLNGDKLTLNKSTTPTKPGYSFDGWYNGLSKVENGATVTSPMTLKAHWNAAQVNYTVIHWWENADDDGYSFHESETKTGLTGTEVNAAAKSYNGFTTQPVTKKTIKGDGSTIVSVYYKRNIYKVEFFDARGRTQYKDLTIEAKYGQDISKQWPTKNESSSWLTKPNGSTFQANIATMPLYGAKFYGPKTGYGTETASYYVQVLPGETGTVKMDGIQYKLDHKDASPGSYYGTTTVTEEDQYPLKGYTFNEGPSTKIGERYDGAKFYYTRNSYNLKFINNGKQDKTVSKKYEQSISSENYTPVRPGSLPDYYEFDGWYDNELCEGEAFDFNGKKMPAQNVTLYAKWTAKKINLTYNLNNPEGDVVKGTKKVEAGTIANTVLPSATTTSDYSFAGWYFADGNGNITADAYNTNEAITKDTSVIGKWLYNGELKVVYDPGTEGSKATVPTDSNIYAGGAKVTVAKNATTTSKKKFLGWKLKGNLYHPGDAFEVNKDLANDDNVITLTAVWGSEEHSTTMSYNPGNGRGDVTKVEVKNNESVTLKSEKSLGYQAPEAKGKEYYFAGWATSMDDANNGKATYAAGQTVHVDVNGENVLYATWIEKTVITLVAKSNTVTYSGEAQSVEGFGDVADGYTISGLTAKATGTNVGEYTTEIKGTAKVTKEDKDVTGKVVVNVVPGKLTISKRNVTLTSASDEKVYDGNALTNDTVTADGFVEGQGATYNVTGTITNVGEKANAFEYSLNKGTNPDNYEIKKAEGTLKVTPVTDKVTVTITGNTGSVKYDGNSHKVTGYTSTFSNALYTANDFAFSGKAEASRTDAGQTDMGLAVEQFTNTSANFTNVEFVVTDGYSKVEKRNVTLTSASDEKVYDGHALTNNKVTASVDGFAKGEGATYDVTGSQKDVGESKNTFSYTLNEGTNADNYNITKTEGTLKVTPVTDKVTVTITGNTGSVKYDGNSHKVTGYTSTFSNALYTANDFAFSGKAEASRTDAGQTDMGLAVEQFTNTSANFTNVEFVVTDGYSKVEKRNVTLTSASDEKVYDGHALTNNKVTASVDGFAKGEGATYDVTGSQKDVGESKNTFTYTLNKGTNPDNYEITKAEGKLIVTADASEVVVTITENSANVTYDGNEHEATGYTTSITGGTDYKEGDFTFNGNASVKGTDAGTYNMELKPEDFQNTNNNYSKVTFVIVDGTLTISKRNVTLTSASDEKVYDGNALTNGTVTAEGFVEGQGATYNVTGSQKDVGESKNTFSYTLNKGTNPDNYEIKKAEGTLKVTPVTDKVTVTITGNTGSVKYDGNSHKVTGYTSTFSNALYTANDFAFSGKAEASRTDAGQTDMGLAVEQFTNTSANFTNVEFVVTDGYSKVEKRNVTLTSASDEKVYDGHALTNNKVTASVDGFAKGEGATYDVTGSQKDVGESKNTFSYTLNEGTNADNYNITKTEGTLKVTPVTDKVTVTITGNTGSVKYDGNSHKVTGYTSTFSNALYTANDFAFSGKAEASRTDAGQTDMGLAVEQFTNTSANFTNVEFVVTDGYSKVEKRNVTLTSASDEKVYDGHALTNNKVTASVDGFAKGEGATYDVTGSQKDVGESKNTFSYTLNEGTNADNYNITKTEGTLKVTPVTDKVVVEIEGKTKTETYNGNTHEVEGYDVTKVSDAVYPEEAIHFEGAAKASRKDVGTSYMGLNASQFSNTSSNFTNVTFKVTDGWLKVNPKSITPDGPNTPDEKKTGIKVTKPDDTMYNGEEQKNKPTVEDTKTGATLVENVDYTLSYTAAVDAGTVEVTITGIGNYTGTAKTSYEITKRNVTLTSASASKTYDKTPLTKKEVTVSGDGFVKEEGATYNVTGSQTKKGTSKNTFTYELKSNTKASNYTIKVVYGDLTVTAEDGEVVVVITGHKKSFEYDGNEKSVKGYDVSITQGSKYAESDFTFNGNDEVKGTEANTYPMGLKASDFTNNNDNYNKVKFVVTDGLLTITPKSITPDGPNTPENKKTGITATDPADSIYDGKAHVNPLTVKDTKTNKDLVENKDYTLTYSDDVVNVGTVTVTVKGIGNYTGEFTKKYQITPREYTVTTDSANKTYDGTALTAGGHVNGLVEGETVNFKTTGSQTNEGTSDNTYELKFKGTAVETNYKHGKDSIGKLKVTKKSIVPDGPDTPDEKKTGIKVTKPDDTMYNGKEQKNKPVVRDTKRDVKLVEDKDYTLSYTAAINAGTVTVTITGIGNYEGTVNTSYEITPRKVIMTSADDTKVYDGNALTKKKVTESGNGFVEGEGATYDVTGSQTDVGFSNNTFSYKLNKGTLASNYTIETKEGRLEVTPFTDKVTVTITGHKDTAVYDGKSHSVEGYDVTKISNALYKKADVQFNGTAKAEGIEVGTYTMKLTPAQFENKNRNFADVEFVVNDGKLEITPKSITPDGPNTPDEKKTGIKVTKPDDTMYNGEEQKNKPTVEDTKTGATLIENVDYTLSYTAAVNAGTVEVTITGIGNYTGTAKTSYEITKRDVLLTSATDSKVYDKKPLMNGKVTESGSGFVKEEGATYNVTGSQTKKGSSKNEFTYELKSNTKASNYTIEVVYGDLTVTAENGEVVVVITGHKKSFEYDGHEKSVKGYDVSITKGSTYEVSDFTFNGNDEVKGTEANTYPMGLKVSDFTNNNDNYNKVKFVVTDGSLTITPKSITPDGPNTPEEKKTGITATDPVDSIYDGKAHVNALTVKDTKTNKDLEENKDYTLTYVGDVVNVGTVKIEVKGIGNYTGEFTKKYQITPREYTVTTDSANKTYDGTALTAGGHVNGLVEGETVNFKTTGSQTNEGTSDNTYELKFKGTAVETNYKHGKDSIGKLTVKKQSIDPGTDPEKPNPNYLGIEISDPSDEVYDGKEHKWSPTVVDKTGKELIVGTDYAVEYATSDFTNVGTINVTITGIGNYTGKVTRTYSITPREYTITTLDGTKVYDGKALTNFGLVDGIVYGETYSFKTTGSQTEVGTSDNTYEFKWDGTAKKSNYKLAKESIGKLTVKAKSIVPDGPDTPNEKKTGITVSEPSDSKYDGKEHKEVLTVTDTKTGKELVAGTDYSVTYSSDLVNAGTVKVTVAGLGNYTGSFTKTYKIIKRSVTLTSATVSKVYDGSALTNTSIAVSGDGFVKGEGASYEVTGTQTEVGNSANAFEYKLNEKTLASNYNITKVVGTLTITAAPAPVTPATPSTPSSTTSTTPRTPSAPQVITPAETVEKETTPKAEPKKEEKVEEEYTPKASPQYYWALINLICAILTVLFGLLLLISKRHKDEDDDEEDDETKQQTNNDDEEKEQEKKRGLFTRVLAVLIAIVSVVFFLVTEDLSLPWTWTDQWTIWMVVIGLVQIVVFFVGRKWKNVDNDDDEEAQQA